MGEILKMANQKVLNRCLENLDRKIQEQKRNKEIIRPILDNLKHLTWLKKWVIQEAKRSRQNKKFITLIKKMNIIFFDKPYEQEEKDAMNSLERCYLEYKQSRRV